MKKTFITKIGSLTVGKLFLVALCLFACQGLFAQTFTGSGNPQPLPPTGTGGVGTAPTTSVANATLNAASNYALTSVNIDITHTFTGDLDITLISPAGTMWDLSSDNGGGGNNFTATVFQDGAPSITTGAAPFTGTFEAEAGPFSTGFGGESFVGNWTLSIQDDAGGDSGTLNSFTITFVELLCDITCPADVLSSTAPGTCDGGFVNIPLPSVNADCAAIPACPVAVAPQTFALDHGAAGTGNLQATTFTLAGVPTSAAGNVELVGAWNDDNSFGTEIPDLSLEGTSLGTLPFGGPDCQENDISITIPVAVYNAAAADGSLTFTVGADNDVNGFCANFPAGEYITLGLNVPTCSVPFANDYNGGQDASDIYAKGTTVVTYTTQDAAGNVVSCSFNVVVADLEAPVLDCPGSETRGLDGGECNSAYFFDVIATDNCPSDPFSVAGPFCDPCDDPTGGSALACAPFAQNSIIQSIATGGVAGTITQVCYNQETFGNTPLATFNIYTNDGSGTVPFDDGAGTFNGLLLGSENYQTVVADNGMCVCVDLATPIAVSTTTTDVWVEIFTPGNTLNSRIVNTPATCNGNNAGGTNTFINAPACGITPPMTFASVGFVLDASYSLTIMPAEIEAIPSPTAPTGYNAYETGDLLPIGVSCFQYEATDASGNVSVCDWCVTVVEFPGPYSNCAVNANINVSVDENCEAIITPDMALEGSAHKCYEEYIVTVSGITPASAIVGNGTNTVIIKASQVTDWGENGMFGPFEVAVSDPSVPSFNCWNGGWMIEDKDAPVITCPAPITISCDASTQPGTNVSGASTAALNGPDEVNVSWGDGGTGGETALTVSAPAGAKVDDLSISIDLDHSWMGDVSIDLTSPDGTTINLLANGGACTNSDNMTATFDATGTAACANGVVTGTTQENCLVPADYLTAAALTGNVGVDIASLVGADAGGDWTITFTDGVGGDGGCVQNISMNVAYTVFAVQAPEVLENCGSFTLTSTDSSQDFDCATGAPFVEIINRTWLATDAKGNTASCVQVINVTAAELANVACPTNYDNIGAPALQCDSADVAFCTNPGWNVLGTSHPSAMNTIPGNPNPDNVLNNQGCEILTGTGYPTGVSCGNLGLTFSDINIGICENSYKVLRTWTIVDWCTGQIKDDCVQIIKVVDNKAPVMDCPAAPIAVSTTTNSCEATFFVSPPATTDNCNSTITYEVSISSGNIQVNGANYVVTGLAIGTHTISWIATDGCDNASAPCDVTVIVSDDIVPVTICETFHVVNLTTNEPTLVYANTFDDGSYDNCEIASMRVRRMNGTSCIDFDWTTLGSGLDETPNGCVNDRDRGESASFSCGLGGILDYPAVPFACCDVGAGEQMVEFRVTDVNGNTNTCMVSVEVDDKLDPVISCPANQTYECSEYINESSDIAIDGLSQNPNDGSEAYYVALNGPGNADNDTTFVGYYANVYDNCTATVYIRDAGTINECGITAPFINRFYTAVDGGGRTDVCVQRLTVVNSFPYFITDTSPFAQANRDGIRWPNDVTLANCDALTDPAQTGEPLIQDDLTILNITVDGVFYDEYPMESTCSQVAVTNTDLELPVLDGACKKILRTWTVIDWCQYNNNVTPATGIWTYEQIIKVEDNVAPTIISGCEDVVFAVTTDNDFDMTNGCTAPVSITLIAEDASVCDAELNYTYWIDYFTDGTQDEGGNTNSFSGIYPQGVHTVSWTVEDACGNITACQHTFEVEDQTAPYMFLASDYVTSLNNNGEAVVWATEFVGTYSDECSGICGELRIGVPSGGPGQTAPPTATFHTFTAAGTTSVDWWVKDCSDNWTYVTGTITVQDGTTSSNPSVQGAIATESGSGVNNVTVSLSGNAPGVMPTMTTNVAGVYNFNNLAPDFNYTVTPDMDLDPLNGVSTYDLVLISKHILQTESLDSPYKMIAADVNMSGHISTLDMVELRKLILFIETEFPVESSTWRFVESDFVFPNASNPWQTTFPEETFINGLTQDEIADFVAVKKGDVNGSAQTGFAGDVDGRTFNGELIFNVADRALVAGNTYTVDFAANEFNNVMGYQFSLAFDNNAIEVSDVQAGELAGMTAGNFGMSKVNEGIITTSWNSDKATSVANNAAVFTVTFTANENTTLSEVFNVSSRYTVAEAYNADLDLMNVAIEYTENETAVAAEFKLLQNTPNPFKNQTVIGFSLPEAANATLRVYDISGKVIRVVEVEGVKGYNETTIDRSELSATGVLYYQLETAEYSATKKMIIVE